MIYRKKIFKRKFKFCPKTPFNLPQCPTKSAFKDLGELEAGIVLGRNRFQDAFSQMTKPSEGEDIHWLVY